MRPRHAGVLLHPTSLPGPGPIGDLGPYAHAFVDWLADAGCDRWQVLPLHPVGAGASPYASPSAFAGDWRLISVERLIEEGLLEPVEIPWGGEAVDLHAVEAWKRPLVERAARAVGGEEFSAWVEAQSTWLPTWAAFAAKARRYGDAWRTWPVGETGDENIATETAIQYLFARHWSAVRAYAHSRGVRIVGDMPLYVAGDSADVWGRPELFRLDAGGDADPVAGVPPDYFSPLGQRWGNPTYAWDRHAAEGYAWWVARLRREVDLVDLVRIDHFRGLAAGWMIPAGEADARNGSWEPGPGEALFAALRVGLGALPLIAEDLGDITADVTELRQRLGLPGMKVLQFAFGGGADHPFLPHNYEGADWVVYTGTHDNDTVAGWYLQTDDATRHRFRRYTGRDGSDVGWAMLREAWASTAETAIAPMQDVIGVGTHGRMNTPGLAEGNWGWRLRDLPWERCGVMRSLAVAYGRAGLGHEE